MEEIKNDTDNTKKCANSIKRGLEAVALIEAIAITTELIEYNNSISSQRYLF